ncbi:hypothetical protein GALMADRAFT_217486 [Galerina marginata CBS 339.88]|uniref:Uncharacterized protein n=1 Tax=Galerina marginata (strain CBS 339.88) TaxID=685588 RepID=A0A067S460_GALM3|nr:hypothetical protein GALMADRAFT_217486 [Galerina marginata CBS 339.88]
MSDRPIQPCAAKRRNCPWKEDFVVEFTKKEFGYDSFKAEEMFKNYGSHLRANDSNGRRKKVKVVDGPGDEDGDGEEEEEEEEKEKGKDEEEDEDEDEEVDEDEEKEEERNHKMTNTTVSPKDPARRSKRKENANTSSPKALEGRKRRLGDDESTSASGAPNIQTTKAGAISKTPETSTSIAPRPLKRRKGETPASPFSTPPPPENQEGATPSSPSSALLPPKKQKSQTSVRKPMHESTTSGPGKNRSVTATPTPRASGQAPKSLPQPATTPNTAAPVPLVPPVSDTIQPGSGPRTAVSSSEHAASPASLPFSELQALKWHNDGLSQQLDNAEKKYNAALRTTQNAIAEKATAMMAVGRLEAELEIMKSRDDQGKPMDIQDAQSSIGGGLACERDVVPSAEQEKDGLERESLEALKLAFDQEIEAKVKELKADCEKQSKDTWAVLDKISRTLARARETSGDGNEEKLRKLQAFVDEQAVKYHAMSKNYMYSQPKSCAIKPLSNVPTPASASALGAARQPSMIPDLLPEPQDPVKGNGAEFKFANASLCCI